MRSRHDLEKGTVTGRPLLCGLDDPEKQLVSEKFFRGTLLVPELWRSAVMVAERLAKPSRSNPVWVRAPRPPP